MPEQMPKQGLKLVILKALSILLQKWTIGHFPDAASSQWW
jgi:hypothetical protein